MGKKGGGGAQSTTTVQKADPWSGVQGNLLDLYGSAGGWFHNAHTVEGTNWDINQSVAMQRQRAMSGISPFMNGAQNTANAVGSGAYAAHNPVMTGQMLMDDPFARNDRYLSNKEATGQFLDQQNPYISGMVQAASRDVNDQFMNDIAPALASQFAMAGRMGSGSHEAAFGQAASGLAKRLGDVSSNIRGAAYESERGRMSQAYEAERARQQQAYQFERNGQMQGWLQMPQTMLAGAGLSGQLAGQRQQMDYTDIQQLQNAGLLQRQINQDVLDEPMKRLSAYSTLLQGASGYGSSTSSQNGSQSQPYNRLTGTIGGGLGGYALGSMMGMGPIGALVGGLGGLFG